jgi:hypothetical protein
MSILTDLFSGGASKLVDSVGTTLDKVITTKGEKMQLDNEIKKADMDFQLEMQKLSVEERKMMYDDIGSARNREEVLSQSPTATTLGKNISSYLAIIATVLCFAMFFILVFMPHLINSSNNQYKDVVIYILGILSALLAQVYSYYFGSSSGSAEKSKTLAQALDKKNN